NRRIYCLSLLSTPSLVSIFSTGYNRIPREMDSMDSKLKPQISVHCQAKANREVVTTPLFKLYQTKRASEDGLTEEPGGLRENEEGFKEGRLLHSTNSIGSSTRSDRTVSSRLQPLFKPTP